MGGPEIRSLWEVEKEAIEQALAVLRWNVTRVSRELGVPKATLYRKLQMYGLNRPKGKFGNVRN